MTERKLRGHARVTFRAHIALVRTELDQGHTAKAIFDRHKTKLGSMSYRQFLRHIGREIIGTSRPSPAPQAAAIPDPSPLPKPIPATGNPPHARHEPAKPRTFEHDGNPRQDDEDRLIFGNRTGPKK